MAYVPDPDDASNPIDTIFISTAAAEFRALKAKVNQNFMKSSINVEENAIYSTKGYAAQNSGGVASETMFGMRGTISRTGGSGNALGGFFSGLLANGVTQLGGAGVGGILAQAFTEPLAVVGTSGIISGTFVVVQQNHAGQPAMAGTLIKFQDRELINDANPVIGGLGDNKYNAGSMAIYIQSQRRSSAGEKCGWSRGIVFEQYSLDDDFDTAQHPCAIDFSGLAGFDSAKMPVPFNFNSATLETVATTNSGAVVPPTSLQGFIRITIADLGIFGIPVCSLNPA